MTPSAQSAPVEAQAAPSLTISPLSETDGTAEFTLACLWRPDIDESRWQAFLRAWRSAPESRGILTARNQRGGVLGFVPWWRQPDLEHGEILWAGPFVVRELGGRPLVRDSLTAALETLARQDGLKLRLTNDP